MRNKNLLKIPTITTDLALQLLKEETATELGLTYGADVSARDNGRIGGQVTKKLIALGEKTLVNMMDEQGVGNVELTQYLQSIEMENPYH